VKEATIKAPSNMYTIGDTPNIVAWSARQQGGDHSYFFARLQATGVQSLRQAKLIFSMEQRTTCYLWTDMWRQCEWLTFLRRIRSR
jgi:hypothetical protein